MCVEPVNGKYQALGFLRPVGPVSGEQEKGSQSFCDPSLKLTSHLCLESYRLVYREVIKHGRVQHKVKMSYLIHFGVFYEMVPQKTPNQLKDQIKTCTPLCY